MIKIGLTLIFFLFKGRCRLRPPFFGWVKRSMNRKPQPADSWWSTHQSSCNGTFVKITEPERINNEKSSNTPFSGKGRTCSSEPTTKAVDFFKKTKTGTKTESTRLKCVNCPNFETESLQELNDHLDSCLNDDNKSKSVIDLT